MSHLILIEGTDCSGKETQANLLVEHLNKEGYPAVKLGFPMYDTPTGKIIGGPYLGKPHILEGWFEEGAINVPSKVAALYYAADRLYNIDKIKTYLAQGIHVVLDRYVESNMGHQGGKIHDMKERKKMYEWLYQLEYNLLELPKPDICLLLYMPYEQALLLRQKRLEKADQHEMSKEHLEDAQKAYLEVAEYEHFDIVHCVTNNQIRTIEDIHDEIYQHVRKKIK